MKKERILIAVKTYPVLSSKYTELVCTAGFREDGSWIRLYPAPFRFLNEDNRYKKYQWIKLDIEKNPKDNRPESYRPRNIDDIIPCEFIPTDYDWRERKNLILEKNKIHKNLNIIFKGQANNKYSLVIFKPKKIIDFISEKVASEWDFSKKSIAEDALNQGCLFQNDHKKDFKLIPKLPYKFSYKFIDDEGQDSTLMIEDWEIGQLYWNCYNMCKELDIELKEQCAIKKVRQKYFDCFILKKDIHLFLGTTRAWHQISTNPYLIIGVFYPPFTTLELPF